MRPEILLRLIHDLTEAMVEAESRAEQAERRVAELEQAQAQGQGFTPPDREA